MSKLPYTHKRSALGSRNTGLTKRRRVGLGARVTGEVKDEAGGAERDFNFEDSGRRGVARSTDRRCLSDLEKSVIKRVACNREDTNLAGIWVKGIDQKIDGMRNDGIGNG